MCDAEIWERFSGGGESAPEVDPARVLMSSVLFREAAVRKACARVGFPYEPLVYPQLAAGDGR